MAHLRFEAGAGLAVVQQTRLVPGREIEKNVRRFLQGEDARLGRVVGKVFQGHGGQPNKEKCVSQDLATGRRVHFQIAPFALGRRPFEGRLEYHRLFGKILHLLFFFFCTARECHRELTSLQLRVSRWRICLRVSMSISVKPSECKANWACASMTSQQRAISSGSSKRRDWLNRRQALRAVRLVSRKRTQARHRWGTMYFLAA